MNTIGEQINRLSLFEINGDNNNYNSLYYNIKPYLDKYLYLYELCVRVNKQLLYTSDYNKKIKYNEIINRIINKINKNFIISSTISVSTPIEIYMIKYLSFIYDKVIVICDNVFDEHELNCIFKYDDYVEICYIDDINHGENDIKIDEDIFKLFKL